jgi:hypothetical protein
LAYLFAEFKSGAGEMTNIHNHQRVTPGREQLAGVIEAQGSMHGVATHAKHEKAKILHGGGAIHKKNTVLALGWAHGDLSIF